MVWMAAVNFLVAGGLVALVAQDAYIERKFWGWGTFWALLNLVYGLALLARYA